MAQKSISAVSVESFEYGVKALRNLAKAQANIIEEVQVNGTKVNPDANKKVNITVPTKVSDITNDSNFQNGQQVSDTCDSKIAAAISSTYKPGGTKAASEILPALLIKANEGKVYNLTTDLTITDQTKGYWVENEAKTIPAGANIGVIETTPESYTASEDTAVDGNKTYYSDQNGTEVDKTAADYSEKNPSTEGWYEKNAAVYKFDALQGLQDLSGYLTPSDITVVDVQTSDIDSWIAGSDTPGAE